MYYWNSYPIVYRLRQDVLHLSQGINWVPRRQAQGPSCSPPPLHPKAETGLPYRHSQVHATHTRQMLLGAGDQHTQETRSCLAGGSLPKWQIYLKKKKWSQ